MSERSEVRGRQHEVEGGWEEKFKVVVELLKVYFSPGARLLIITSWKRLMSSAMLGFRSRMLWPKI